MMQVGFAQRDITPYGNPFGGYRLSGVKRHSGIHDPLFAHVLAIRVGERTCLLCSLDIGMLPQERADDAKAEIARTLGIEPAAILIAATHTHSGPETLNEEDDPRIGIWDPIQQSLVEAASEAADGLTAAKLSWAKADLPIAVNRFQHRLGRSGNTIDRHLDVLIFESPAGKHLGLLYHYAAHPTCAMGTEHKVSGDYCGLADRIIEKRTGGFSMFLNGACGNINLEVSERSFARAEERAGEVAAGVFATLTGPRTRIEPTVDWVAGSIRVGIKRELEHLDVPNDLERKKAVLEQDFRSRWQEVVGDPRRQEEAFLQYDAYRKALWKVLIRREYAQRPTEEVHLQCIRIGPMVLVAVPGEMFIEHQLRLQKQFPGQRVLVVGYANGYVGYIPTSEAMTSKTYETQTSLVHRVDGQAGDRLVAAAGEMIRSLCDGAHSRTACSWGS